MSERVWARLPGAIAPAALALLIATTGCGGAGSGGAADPGRAETMTPQRTIAEIIAERAPAWMAIPGVAGVYESRTEDGAPCLKVMVERDTPEIRDAIPSEVEGYPVLIRETGPIAPRGDGG